LKASLWYHLSVLPVFAVCPLPPEPENGGYICHPRPCRDPLTAGSVIEYLCAEGYMLKGDYKYLTCKNGEWKPAMEISCRLNEGQSASEKGMLPRFSFLPTPREWCMLPPECSWLCCSSVASHPLGLHVFVQFLLCDIGVAGMCHISFH
jgi:hypothetical protein